MDKHLNKIYALLLIIIVAAFTILFTKNRESVILPPYTVVDGDTFISGSTRYRLIDVDAPESDQPMGSYATQCLTELLANSKLAVEEHGLDKYGRVLVQLRVGNEDAHLSLIQAGCVWAVPHFMVDEPFKLSVYKDAQQDARLDRVGLWQQLDPINPYQWRKSRH